MFAELFGVVAWHWALIVAAMIAIFYGRGRALAGELPLSYPTVASVVGFLQCVLQGSSTRGSRSSGAVLAIGLAFLGASRGSGDLPLGCAGALVLGGNLPLHTDWLIYDPAFASMFCSANGQTAN